MDIIKDNIVLIAIFGVPFIIIVMTVILMGKDINEDQSAINVKANAQAHSGKARAETKQQSDDITRAVANITLKGKVMNAERQGAVSHTETPKPSSMKVAETNSTSVEPESETPITNELQPEPEEEELQRVLSKSKRSRLEDRIRSRR